MDEVMEQIIDKMDEITEKTSCREFKIITTKTEVVKFYKFDKFAGIKFDIESEEIEILYNDKIYSVNEFLNL